MNLPAICIVTDAQKININLVFSAMGMGPETFTRKLCAPSPTPTWETSPTHWLMSAAGATDTDVAIWQAMTNGNLPQPAAGIVWGVDGAISAEDAMAATAGTVFHVYSAAGEIEPADHVTAVLATEGLVYVPDAPI